MKSASAKSPQLHLDWEIVVAFLTYAAASASDCLVTLTGLLDRQVRELNPVLNGYIEHFGVAYGLVLPKALIGATVILASTLYIHSMHRAHRTRVRAEYILYGGALFTALAPLHWLPFR